MSFERYTEARGPGALAMSGLGARMRGGGLGASVVIGGALLSCTSVPLSKDFSNEERLLAGVERWGGMPSSWGGSASLPSHQVSGPTTSERGALHETDTRGEVCVSHESQQHRLPTPMPDCFLLTGNIVYNKKSGQSQ